MEKLISMTDFVLQEERKGMQNTDRHLRFERILKYAHFLKKPLKLEMFVPCDDNGSFLEEPNKKDYVFEHHPELVGNPKEYDEDRYRDDCLEYIMAKEKVLFEGFVYTDSQKYSYLNRIPLSVSPYGLKNERLQLTKLKEDNKFHTWLQLYTIEDLTKCDLDLTQNAIKRLGL